MRIRLDDFWLEAELYAKAPQLDPAWKRKQSRERKRQLRAASKKVQS